LKLTQAKRQRRHFGGHWIATAGFRLVGRLKRSAQQLAHRPLEAKENENRNTNQGGREGYSRVQYELIRDEYRYVSSHWKLQ
jgi:hypothetical protein